MDCAFIEAQEEARERNINMKHFLLSFLQVIQTKTQTCLLQRQILKQLCEPLLCLYTNKSYRESYFISEQIKPISVKKTGLSLKRFDSENRIHVNPHVLLMTSFLCRRELQP